MTTKNKFIQQKQREFKKEFGPPIGQGAIEMDNFFKKALSQSWDKSRQETIKEVIEEVKEDVDEIYERGEIGLYEDGYLQAMRNVSLLLKNK